VLGVDVDVGISTPTSSAKSITVLEFRIVVSLEPERLRFQ
jgi:hypothetical protein